MLHHKRIVILDFDSTLFDITSFVTALPVAVAEEFGDQFQISASAVESSIKAYYVGTIGYDVHAHLASFGVVLGASNHRSRLISRILQVHQRITGRFNLLFEDVPQALERLIDNPQNDLAIMSVNLQSGFEFKRDLCGGLLDGIPAQIVSTNKGELLAVQWAKEIIFNGRVYHSALVIDDHPLQIAAVPDRELIVRRQLVRAGQRYPGNTAGIPVIESLADVS